MVVYRSAQLDGDCDLTSRASAMIRPFSAATLRVPLSARIAPLNRWSFFYEYQTALPPLPSRLADQSVRHPAGAVCFDGAGAGGKQHPVSGAL